MIVGRNLTCWSTYSLQYCSSWIFVISSIFVGFVASPMTIVVTLSKWLKFAISMENIDSTFRTFLTELFHHPETVLWLVYMFLDFQDEPQAILDKSDISWLFSFSKSDLKSVQIEVGTILLESSEQRRQFANRDDGILLERGDPLSHLLVSSKAD